MITIGAAVRLSGLMMATLLASPVRADRAADIAQIHIDAIGGSERIKALSSFRATGRTFMGRDELKFTMIAARPDRVRLETEKGGRTLVQGSDGVNPPWEFDTGTWPPVYRAMPDVSAKTFAADAEFDDPLVTAQMRGYTLEFGGEVEFDGKKLFRILVTRKLAETTSVLVDPDTYFVLKRVEFRFGVSGRKIQVVTHYADFRPVNGVLMPHRIMTSVDGRLTQQTQITKMEPNPKLDAQTFSRPKTAPETPQKS